MNDKKPYAITVTEVLVKTVLVLERTPGEALKKVEEAYENAEIVLDYDNFIEAEINLSPDWKDGIFTGSTELYEEVY